MKKTFTLLYAGTAYLVGLANIAYIVAFLADFGTAWGIPKTIASGGFDRNLWQAVLVDAALVAAFGLHHSVTARTAFKTWWTRLVPAHLERATYLYMTAGMSVILVAFWQPIPVTIWQVETGWAVAAIIAAYLSAWTMMFLATFHFGHFGFFGLAQAWRRIREIPPAGAPFTARCLYALVRHPISLGWMITPWLTPHLTIGHAVFGLSALAYILAATHFEEADLIAEFGDRYRRYRRDVPAFLPVRRRHRG